MAAPRKNVDPTVAKGFGDEWSTFRQDDTSLTSDNRAAIFADYFRIFPWNRLPAQAVGADVGCGSGRWAVLVAPRVGTLHLVDASSDALETARENLRACQNVTFHETSASELPFPDASLDFVYSLGVLHHVPDTAEAIQAVARKLKPGAPFLLYLYYDLDNRPSWYRTIWRVSELIRRTLSHRSRETRRVVSGAIAATVYWPLARAAALFKTLGFNIESLPLCYYADKSFYVMRTDAYDRFCTTLEQRFTRAAIDTMMRNAGLDHIQFSDRPPYWCAVGLATGRPS